MRQLPALVARASTLLAVLAVLAAGSVIGSPARVAAQPDPAGSLPACSAGLPQLRYLVLFDAGTPWSAVHAEVSAACGVPVSYYPEIAVAVASSTDRWFADRIGRDRAYSAQAESLSDAERSADPAPLPPQSQPRQQGAGRQPVARVLPSGRLGPMGLAGAAGPPVVQTGNADRTADQWNLKLIKATQASQVTTGNPSVLVGVLDSGVDAGHPDLAAALDASASVGCVTGRPDRSRPAWQASGGHGTHVAGVIAAADDGRGVTGVAPGVRIASVKVVDQAGMVYPESVVCGLVWAANQGMRVTNNSYFVDPWLFTCRDQPGQAVAYEAVRRAAGYAAGSGVLTVAAVGNESIDLAGVGVDRYSPNNAERPRTRTIGPDCQVLPAELPGVLTVAAVGAQREKSSYSSYGLDVVDVAAPGGDLRQRAIGSTSGCVLSTVPGGYGRMCGTSMASPHVAGVAALVASQYPKASPDQLAEQITGTAKPLDCPEQYDPDSDGQADAVCQGGAGVNGFYGSGLLNALGAVTR